MRTPSALLLAAIACIAGLVVWLVSIGGGTDLPDAAVVAPSEPTAARPAEAALEAVPHDPADFQTLTEVEELDRDELEPLAAPATAAEEAALALGPRGVFRGRLLDAATRAPLPRFLLRVHDRAHREDVWTDAEGRFASTTAFLVGRLRVDPLDHPDRRRAAPSQQVDHELEEVAAGAEAGADDGDSDAATGAVAGTPAVPPAGREVELAVPSGPTYFLALEPREGVPLELLRANLLVASDEERDRLGFEGVRAPAAGDPSELPWIRFGPVAPDFDRAERIEVRTSDGIWRGDANVSALQGVQLRPVTVKLEALAALSGRVVDEAGAPVPRAMVRLREGPAGGRDQRRDAQTDAEGRYRFEFVRPLECFVTAATLRHARAEGTLTLAPAQTATLDLTLTPKPLAGAIRGEVVTLTGASTPKARIVLALPNGDRSATALETELRWTTVEGRKVGRFEFLALPEGPFTLRVEKDDWLRWNPRQMEVKAPREDVRIVVNDDVSTCDYVLRVRDRDNGLPLDRLRVWVEFVEGPSRERRAASDEPIERAVPLERKFRWRLDRAGYVSERGDERAFALETTKDGRIQRILELDLAPGWRDVIRAVRRDGKGPIEGVEIVVDGRVAGKTAKDGTLVVELRDPPTRIEATHPSWNLQGQPDLRPAWRRNERKFVLLRFNPAPKKPRG